MSKVPDGQRNRERGTTREQVIILGFIAGAFVTGWLTHAITGPRSEQPPDGAGAVTATAADRFERAIGEGRRALERTIRAYHTTVSRALEDGGTERPRESQLEILARALSALASAVDHAAIELDEREPLAVRLRASGLELRELALDVLARSQRDELPTVFDELEQNLISAASAILSSAHPRIA